jgi:antitoxin YefM
MAHVGFTDFRQNLASHLDAVVKSRAPLTVTRQKGASVVVLSAEEFESMQETLHLLSNPANGDRLRRSIEQMELSQGQERPLADI